MASSILVTMLVLAAALAVSVSGASVTPIQKVLTMIESLKAKGVQAKADEEVAFSAFNQFCANTRANKGKSIEAGAMRLEQLEADIAKAASDVEAASQDLAELDEDLARWAKDKSGATDVRKKERADYEATHLDYSDTLDAVDRALNVIKSMPEKVDQKSFLQTHLGKIAQSPVMPPKARHALVALLATVANPLDVEAPEASAYDSQSGGVSKMLEDLRERFRSEKTALEKEEMSNRHAYQSIMQRLTDQVELAKQENSQKTKLRAQRTQDQAEATGEQKETQASKAEDEKYLSDLNSLCHTKSSEFESRQNLRADEIQALSKAIDIIGSQAVQGAGDKHLPALAQQGAGVAFAQLRQPAASSDLQRVAALLAQRAQALHSPTLALIAQKAQGDAFGKVKSMIKDLITKLMEQAAGESDHKAFCDAELATNKQTRTYKAEAVEELTAEVEKQTAKSAKLASDISELSEDISDVDAAMASATKERQQEKAKNANTVTDAKDAQTAVAQALSVLRDFYAKAAQATALVQRKGPAEDATATWDSSYTGMGSQSTGVVGMLEVIESDFARLETSTDSAEDQAAAAFKKFMNDSKEDKALKETEMNHKTNRRTTTEEVLVSTKRSLQQTQAELDSALNYYDKLKPDCVDSGTSYEERVHRREEELESLQDAYKILAGEELPDLQAMKAEQI